jgi:hypothetical protein
MTSNALVAQVRADKVAAGGKSGRWENALYGSIGGLIVVLTALAIGFLMNRHIGYWEPSSVVVLSLIFGFTIGVMWLGSEVVGDFSERTMSPYMGPMASATKVHVESDHCDTKSAARKPAQEGGSRCLATTPG